MSGASSTQTLRSIPYGRNETLQRRAICEAAGMFSCSDEEMETIQRRTIICEDRSRLVRYRLEDLKDFLDSHRVVTGDGR
jgi:hypothetical protein